MIRKVFLSFLFLILLVGKLKSQEKIELLNADSLLFDQGFGDMQRLKGNVFFKQKDVFMKSDSAWFYEGENRLEAFGKIHIYQKDSFDLFGHYLQYDGNSRTARVENDVELTDNDMVLYTQSIEYDIPNKKAYYLTEGRISDNENDLTSQTGTYYSRSKKFSFNENVVLTNPKYKMTSNKLDYFSNSKTAFFYGPTYIRSDENTIFCNSGWYDTQNETSRFSKNVWIQTNENKLQADSLVYDRKLGLGKAFRNVVLSDSLNQVFVYGHFARYTRENKRTTIVQNPIALQIQGRDTFFLTSDTFVDHTDSSGKRHIQAFPKVRFLNLNMQGKADSLIYHLSDSVICLYYEPILWNDSNQLSADTLLINQGKGGINFIDLKKNGFVISKENSLVFNQIKGKNIRAKFSRNELKKVFVNEDGSSLYYVQEEDSTYSGINKIACQKIEILMDSAQVQNILFLTKPKGTFYPVDQLSETKNKLEGFDWRTYLRPRKKEFRIPNN